MDASPLPDIRIPADLLPSDGRFGSGPSKVRQEAMDALAATGTTYLGTSHRRPAVKSVVGRIRAGLREMYALPDGYEVLLGNGGTTSFWDAATFCLIEQHSQHLDFGEFSAKFAKVAAAAPHVETAEVIQSAPGTHPEPRPDAEIDSYALTHNETSTGVMMDVRRPAGGSSVVLVDGTSAAGGLRVDSTQFDCYYFAPQKCFASDGGLWLALCSPAAIERIERLTSRDATRWAPPTLDLGIALENSRADQTYNTPALATLFLLAEQIDWMLANGGLEWSASRCDRSAEILYGWAEGSAYATPFVAKPDDRSRVVATIAFDDDVDTNTISAILRANGIVDTEPYRKLGGNTLRIAMFPAIEPDDVAALTACIDHVAEVLRG